ncbi:hypothetical protein [Schlesneria sp. DSM 10557]|uniref:hypothetical protein n=1 Tax=Schlesneria sp. DSM 10557 TaxID=3044399 RepID=UPI0035A00667
MTIPLPRSRTSIPLVFLVLLSGIPAGCGQSRGYPTVTVATPLGREGVCVSCSRKIESVTEQNLVTVEGNQFIVCSEACADKADLDVEHAHEGHSH